MSNIVLSYRHYPCSIGRYFKFALKELGHTLYSVGTYSPTIPWNTSRDYTDYLDIPDYETPSDMFCWEVNMALRECSFEPDAIISVDAGYYLVGANTRGIPSAVILTDPHAFAPPQSNHYLDSLTNYEYAAVMQQTYMPLYEHDRNGHKVPSIWLPYAASPKHHYWNGEDFNSRPIDVMLISGLLYNERKAGFEAMTKAGLVTYQDSGLLLEQTSEAYGESVIAYNWSSANDLCARFFEGLSMRNLVLTNRIPELRYFLDLQENEHYIAFDSVEECVDKAKYYSTHRDEAWEIASRGFAAFWAGHHTYTQRINLVLDLLGLK